MSEQDNRRDGSLVPAGRRDLATVAAVNPLVSRGVADLAKTRLVTKTEDHLRQPARVTSLAVEEGLQALLEAGKVTGYLTCFQVGGHLNTLVFRDWPDGHAEVHPTDAVKQEKLDRLAAVLEMQGIQLVDESNLQIRAKRWRENGEFGETGEFDKAIAAYSLLIRLHPCPGLFGLRGITWQRMREYDKAIADFDEAIRIDPTRADRFITRGNAWYAKKEYEKAIADYEKAKDLDPKSVLDEIVRARNEQKRAMSTDIA